MTPELLSRYGMDMLPGPDPLRPEGAGPPPDSSELARKDAIRNVAE